MDTTSLFGFLEPDGRDAARPELTVAALAGLRPNRQLATFRDAIGDPVGQVQVGPFTEWRWERPEAVVLAYTNGSEQVLAYSVSTVRPGFPARVPFAGKDLVLTESHFADVRDEPFERDVAYPADGRELYEERYEYLDDQSDRIQVILSDGFVNYDAVPRSVGPEVYEIQRCSSSPDDPVEPRCDQSLLGAFRASKYVTAFAVGRGGDLDEISREGGQLSLQPG